MASSRWIGAVFLALVLIVPLTSLAAMQTDDRIVAIVNSDLIMLSEMKQELTPTRERIQNEYRGSARTERLKTAEFIALTSMIERKLQLQEAKTRGIEINDREVQQALKQFKEQGEKIDELNPTSLKNIKEQLLLLKVVDREVRSVVMVGNGDISRHFQAHRDRFALPEEYILSQILIKHRPPEDKTSAKDKIRELIALLKRGESFEDLALRFSDGPFASQGGRIGLIRQGELVPEIERTLMQLVTGNISDMVETSEGFHLLRLDDKRPKQFRPLEEVRNEIQGLVFQQKNEDIFQSWLANLKNKAYIEIKFEAAPSTLPTTDLAPRSSPTSKE